MQPAAILEHLPDAVVAADREGIIRAWNEAASRIFGYAPHEAIGQSLDLIIPERLRDAHWKAYDVALEAGTTKNGGKAMRTRAMPKSGEKLYVSMRFAIVRDAEDRVVGAVALACEAEGA